MLKRYFVLVLLMASGSLCQPVKVYLDKMTKFEDDGEVRLDTCRGKYLFPSIWGKWCKPCRDELDE